MDKIKEYLPIISVILLILGAIRLVVFYHFFGIDITTYIDLSEIFILSLPFFLTSALFLMVCLSYAMLGVVYDTNNEYSTANSADLTLLKEPSRPHIRASYYILTYFTLFLMPMILLLGPERDRIGYDLYFVLIPVCLVLPPIIPSMHNWIARSYQKAFQKELRSNHLFLFIASLLLMLFSVVFTRTSARKALYNDESITMTYNGEVVKTTDTYSYIGKTKNYAFFYNDNTGYADVYTLSDVKHFSIKDNEPHRRRRTRKKTEAKATPMPKNNAQQKEQSIIADSAKK